MSKLETRSITDRVREILQREIEEGRLRPGTRIIEVELARDFGISKTPLRLAIHQLKQEGLIHVEPRQGIYVKQHSLKETLELMEIRAVLEGLAARRVAMGSDPNAVVRLRECLTKRRSGRPASGLENYALLDQEFHRSLAAEARSTELERSLQIVHARLMMRRLRELAIAYTGEATIHREHMEILDAIGAGDGDRAETLATAHVRNIPWLSILETSGLAAPGAADADTVASPRGERRPAETVW
jgi:DNA-binding GntR family transcriptional regulator